MSGPAKRLAPASSPAYEGRLDVFLRPGQYFVGDHRHEIRTVLGSCVSITLWHPRLRIGAMSHFLLSHNSTRHASQVLDARYGEGALRLMLRELRRWDVNPAECGAKIFGGGNMFPEQHKGAAAIDIGRRNGEAARTLLQAQGIAILSESLFGEGHRQIVFDVANGDVWSRQLKPVCPAAMAGEVTA
ncbi:MAG TPA: chemotaxis protein CheD [Ideonella sp.]|nr:chemotaxis protein CheD [Ideonella sp.]